LKKVWGWDNSITIILKNSKAIQERWTKNQSAGNVMILEKLQSQMDRFILAGIAFSQED